MLYVRMVLIMIVNLYMSRVVLQILGVEDFGIYSVVGSFVALLGVLNTAMTAASQRFLSYAEGSGYESQIISTFNSVVKVQLSIAVIILIIGEIFGPIYIYRFLNVPENRVHDSYLVFQFSLATFVLSAASIPFTASIIAREKMNVYAWVSIFEVLIKLGLVFCLKLLNSQHLVWYSVFIFLSTLITQTCYFIYSTNTIGTCKIRLKLSDSKITKQILRYSAWNLMGSFSGVAIDQGVNMILNSFFSVAVNAARGISFQVSGAMSQLYSNFLQALSPQIVKSYASHGFNRLYMLIIQGTRLSFFLLFVFAAPILFNIETVLNLWLGQVPEYATTFCVLILINCLLASLSQTILSGAMASGNIKKYQIVVSIINFLNFPLSLIALYIRPNPYITAYIMIALTIIAFCARLIILRQLINISILRFIKEALIPILKVVIVVVACSFLVGRIDYFGDVYHSIGRFLIDFIITFTAVVFIGVSKSERQMVWQFIVRKIRK